MSGAPPSCSIIPSHRRRHPPPPQGFCYRKQESFALSLLLPVLLLGHLSGLLPEAGEKGLAAAATALLLVFAARKYTQPVREDIGGERAAVGARSALGDGLSVGCVWRGLSGGRPCAMRPGPGAGWALPAFCRCRYAPLHPLP